MKIPAAGGRQRGAMKKVLIRIAIGLGIFIGVVAIVFFILFFNEIQTLSSLKKVDEYPLYTMTYTGDYGFDEFLKTGAKSDKDIEKFVTKRLLKGLDIDLGVAGDGCTAFTAYSDEGDRIFSRNFDFTYSPSMLLFTHPDNGYASVSTVNLTYAGFTKEHLPDGLFNSFMTLAAPYLPFDGMNEKGLAVSLLAVPEAQGPADPKNITLNTTTTIRLLLDKAATVDQAVELLNHFNIYFSDDTDCHYLISDATGKSVIVEYWDGQVQVTDGDKYQIASNFIAYNNMGEGFSEFDRYNAVKAKLEPADGVISVEDAMGLLQSVGIIFEGEDKLQWSVIYNQTDLTGEICAHRNTQNMYSFSLK